MDPIKKLVEEHRTILTVLESFNNFAAKTVSSDYCDREKLGEFVKFIQQFADKYHHAKEEDILFVTMEENGYSKQVGPLAVMLHEHVEGRKFVKFLHEASLEPQDLTDDERRAVANAIRGYADLLRGHIYKEDNILYPMASQNLPKDIYKAMIDKFDLVENQQNALGEVAKLEELGRKLVGMV